MQSDDRRRRDQDVGHAPEPCRIAVDEGYYVYPVQLLCCRNGQFGRAGAVVGGGRQEAEVRAVEPDFHFRAPVDVEAGEAQQKVLTGPGEGGPDPSVIVVRTAKALALVAGFQRV